MGIATGKFMDEIRVNGTELCVTGHGLFLKPIDVLEHPGNLRARKIGIEYQTRFTAKGYGFPPGRSKLSNRYLFRYGFE